MIRIIASSFCLGRRDVAMGLGAARVLEAGAVERLRQLGHEVETTWVDPGPLPTHETGAHFTVHRAFAREVRRAHDDAVFPFVLGGSCGSAVGACAGSPDPGGLGLVWYDAHGDANTPETTESGFIDGMPVAVLTGRCWTRLAARVPGFVPVRDEHVLLAGVRDLDVAERALVEASDMALTGPGDLGPGGAFERGVDALAARTSAVHVHIDLDVIDPTDGVANEYATSGGPPLSVLEESLAYVGERCRVSSVSLTSYDPELDEDGHALASCLRLLDALGRQVPISC